MTKKCHFVNKPIFAFILLASNFIGLSCFISLPFKKGAPAY